MRCLKFIPCIYLAAGGSFHPYVDLLTYIGLKRCPFYHIRLPTPLIKVPTTSILTWS